MPIDWMKVEEKWRKLWEKSKIFETNIDTRKPKFFITVAYPYPNSPQHIGHARTYTMADVHARYMRMRGYNVLFPMAFHYTGTPILAMSKRLAAGDEDLIDTFTRIYKVPPDLIKEFSEPLKIAQYFHQEIKQGMMEMAYSIDWRREFTTIDPGYNQFIKWQFEKLREKGFITQGSHPVGWCPCCGNPVGQHDTVGDVEPEIEAFTLIKFNFKEYVIPAATLRPETVFGATNLWINPEVNYVKAKVNGEHWIISRECAEKLRFLNRDVEVIEAVKGVDLVGEHVENPVTGNKIPILPATFVDPKNATGVVMSVPGHAPYDYQALEDLRREIKERPKYKITPELIASISPISIIEVDGYSELPAADAVKRMGVESQNDPRLEEATKEVYGHEFHRGRMKENTKAYAGLPVAEAKEKVKKDLLLSKKADSMYEIVNKPVVCRCGSECIVKIFEKQWFINYGDESWKASARECLRGMSILPEELRPEFEYTIDWLREKACARKSGLGTKLPWDEEWIIESLSDSVIYMSYYTIARFLKDQEIDSSLLTNEVFDYVFLGLGELRDVAGKAGVKPETLKMMREEFAYFYPLDSRHSGRDLVPNHLTFFIFNHVAIFPRELWPRQIVVNGSVLMEGKKMSKSLGNIIPLREAAKTYGVDPLRLAVVSTSELLQDADFSSTLAKSLNEKLERFYNLALNVIKLKGEAEEGELAFEDKWLLSRLQRSIKAATEAMDRLRVREAVHHALYVLDKEVQWYMRRISLENSTSRRKIAAKVLNEVLDSRVRLLAPFAPYICEEIWEKMGNEGFVSTAEWPKYDEGKIDVKAEEAEEIVRAVLEDTENVIKATGIKPRRICYYTSADWKWKAYLAALNAAETGGLSVGMLMKELLSGIEAKERAEELAKYAKKMIVEVARMPPDMRRTRLQANIINEFEVLKSAVNFYEKEFNAEVEVYNESNPGKYDPKNRAQLAQPYRPAIYVE